MKTVAAMDILESAVFLNESHGSLFLPAEARADKKRKASGTREFVLVAGGEKGVLRAYAVRIQGKDLSTFTASLLTTVPVNASPEEVILTPEQLQKHSSSRSKASGTGQKSSGNRGSDENIFAVRGLHYLPNSGQIVATTSDHVFCTFAFNAPSSSSQGGMRNRQISPLVSSEHIVGSYGDILGISYVPSAKPSLAVVTNSPQVRLVGDDFRSYPLSGHTDIVLAVDCSPDG